MKRQSEIVKFFKSCYNSIFNKNLPKQLKTTGFRDGKQSTFICGECGIPMPSNAFHSFDPIYRSPDASEHLGGIYTRILVGSQWYKGFAIHPQIQYFEQIKNKFGPIKCQSCGASGFQNILVQKIKDFNLCVLL